MTAKTPFQAKGPPTSFWRSLQHAWDGLVHTVVHQRNMRIHVISAILVGLVGSGVRLGLAEKATMLFCVLLVLFAEMLNSALEHLVDLATQEFDENAKRVKDIAAAAVLVLAAGTVVIFAAVLVHNTDVLGASLPAIQRQVIIGVPLTFLAGALMHEQPRPKWVDGVLTLAALGAWGLTLPATESQVFSAMTLGLVVVCAAAARERRKNEARRVAGLS